MVAAAASLTFVLELDAQVGVVFAGQAPDVLHRAAADLATLPRELHDVTDVEVGGRARAERTLVGDETRVAANTSLNFLLIFKHCHYAHQTYIGNRTASI